MLKINKASLVAVAGMLALRASAQLTNPGFETGDFTGWTLNGPTLSSVDTTVTADSGNVYTAPSGKYFASIYAGLGANVYTTVSQSFTLAAGQSINGWAAFLAHDYLPFDDDGYVAITTPTGFSDTVWTGSVGTVGDYGDSGWQPWSFTSLLGGAYTLTFAVENDIDNELPSQVLFDMPEGKLNGVPDGGSTMLLMSLGSLGLAAIKRKLS